MTSHDILMLNLDGHQALVCAAIRLGVDLKTFASDEQAANIRFIGTGLVSSSLEHW